MPSLSQLSVRSKLIMLIMMLLAVSAFSILVTALLGLSKLPATTPSTSRRKEQESRWRRSMDDATMPKAMQPEEN